MADEEDEGLFDKCFLCSSIKRGKNRAKTDTAKHLTADAIAKVKTQCAVWKSKDGLPDQIISALHLLDIAFMEPTQVPVQNRA